MAFIDHGYYMGEYKGSPISEEEFEQFAERACDIIEALTAGKASGAVKKENGKATAAKKAACAQTEMLYSLGGKEYLGAMGTEISREEIGNASVSYRHKSGLSYLGIPISGLAMMFLTDAGLIQRAI